MTTISEIEHAVAGLQQEDFNKFRAWFEEFESSHWDAQFEQDVKTGKLDALAEQRKSLFTIKPLD